MVHESELLGNQEARNIIENEGLGYAVTGYIDGKYFKDPITRKLWEGAEKALSDLEIYLDEGEYND